MEVRFNKQIWNEQIITEKLYALKDFDKNTMWLKGDLSIHKKNFIEKLLWSIIKWFYSSNDLTVAANNLERLKLVVAISNQDLKTLFDTCVDRVNQISEKCNIAHINTHATTLTLDPFVILTPAELANLLSFYNGITEIHSDNNTWILDQHLEKLATYTSLTHLSLKHCKSITDKGLIFLKTLNNLKVLEITYCQQITGTSLNQLPKSIQELNLRGNNLQQENLKHLQYLTELTKLNIGQTSINNLALLPNINLEELYLDNCPNITKSSFDTIQINPDSLNKLSLSCCLNITNFTFLEKFLYLEYLNLSRCAQISTFTQIEAIKDLRLRFLDLRRTSVEYKSDFTKNTKIPTILFPRCLPSGEKQYPSSIPKERGVEPSPNVIFSESNVNTKKIVGVWGSPDADDYLPGDEMD
ncbi:MAG: hypothetical protein P4L16_02245 [Chlamydiales bacterium]|nr:hypothetical protein [Chlamydiales bacterium]